MQVSCTEKQDRTASRRKAIGIQSPRDAFDIDDELCRDGNDGRIIGAMPKQHDERKTKPPTEHRRGGDHMDEFKREDEIEHRRGRS